jgi:hypothetical protein
MRFRRAIPPDLAAAERAFHRVLDALEPAKRALTDAMPGTRLPGAPLPGAVAAFLEGVDAAERGMAAWRRPELDPVWTACEAGLRAARTRAEALAHGGEIAGFEGMLVAVSSLLDPLDPFADAERAFRDLRRKRVHTD